jgi:hypothetical protein
MELEGRYQQIWNQLEELSDFSVDSLTRSRNLFHLENQQVIPRRFEVWTLVVGLPLSNQLTHNFQTLTQQITERLSVNTRFYKVLPQNYHWELFIIKRPDEEVAQECLQKTPDILREVLGNQRNFRISYRGFLITADGTIIIKGYGNFDELRDRLRQKLPWASLQQSNLGHISLGRILEPVGYQCFTELKDLVRTSENEFYGELEVSEVKYIHESQWYMEDREVVAVLALGT